MKFKMKGLPYLLLSLALSGSVLASVPVKKHHGHHGYKGEGLYKGEVFAPEQPRNHFEIIGAPGIARLSAGNSELGVTSSETDRLVQTNSNAWNTLAGQLGFGYVYYFGHAQKYSDCVQWFPSIEPELNVYYLSSNSIKGDVWRFDNSAFNDLTFDIPLRSTRLMLDAALTVASWKQISIYAIGGIGNAWNRIGYSDKDNDNGDVTDTCPEQRLSLNNRSQSKFVWEAGAGATYAFNDRFGLSLEWLYTNLGNVRTSGSGDTATITAPVIVPAHFNLKSQTLLLGLHIAV